MMTKRGGLLCTAIGLVLLVGAPVAADAGAASQAVRREIVRRAEVAAAERAAVRAAEQAAARRAAIRAAEQQAARAEALVAERAAAARAAKLQGERQAALRRALVKDSKRDAATKTVPLKAERRVWRYTSKQEAERELKSGVPAGAHMTPKVGPGRPPSGVTAQHQYGLPRAPEARMKIRLDRGTPVAHNKALAGQAGRGELTAPATVPKENIEKVIVLH
jgi:translation initiation factor IF-2